MEADIIVAVRFKTTEEGGRRSGIPVPGAVADYYACAFLIDGEAFDCRLLLTGRRLDLGQTYEVPVKFLHPELARRILSPRKTFVLWEGKEVATGEIVRRLAETEQKDSGT